MRLHINDIYIYFVDVGILDYLISFDNNIFDSSKLKTFIYHSLLNHNRLMFRMVKAFYMVKFSKAYDIIVWTRTWHYNSYNIYYYWRFIKVPLKLKFKYLNFYYYYIELYSQYFIKDYISIFYNTFLIKNEKNIIIYNLLMENNGIYFIIFEFLNKIIFENIYLFILLKIKYFFSFLFLNIKLNWNLFSWLVFFYIYFSFYFHRIYYFIWFNLKFFFIDFEFKNFILFIYNKINKLFYNLRFKNHLIFVNIITFLFKKNSYLIKLLKFLLFKYNYKKNLIKIFKKNKFFLLLFYYIYINIELIYFIKLLLKNFIISIYHLLLIMKYITIFIKFPSLFKKEYKKDGEEKEEEIIFKNIKIKNWFYELFDNLLFEKSLKDRNFNDTILKLKEDLLNLEKNYNSFSKNDRQKWKELKQEVEKYPEIFEEEDLIYSKSYLFYIYYRFRISFYFWLRRVSTKIIELEGWRTISKAIILIDERFLLNWKFYIIEVFLYRIIILLFSVRFYYFYFILYSIYLFIFIYDFYTLIKYKNYLLKLYFYFYLLFFKKRIMYKFYFIDFILKKLIYIYNIIKEFDFDFITVSKFFYYFKKIYLDFIKIYYYYFLYFIFNKFLVFFVFIFIFIFFFNFNLINYSIIVILKIFYYFFFLLNIDFLNLFSFYFDFSFLQYYFSIKISWYLDGFLFNYLYIYKWLYKYTYYRVDSFREIYYYITHDFEFYFWKKASQWYKRFRYRKWRRGKKFKLIVRFIYGYYLMKYYIFFIETSAMQINSKGIFFWLFYNLYFFFQWFINYVYLLFFESLNKYFYWFYLYLYLNYLINFIFIIFYYFFLIIVMFFYYINNIFNLSYFFNLNFNIFKILFFYFYFLLFDLLIFFSNCLLFFFYNIFLSIFNYIYINYIYFIIDLNLFLKNVMMKFNLFWYSLMKNFHTFEILHLYNKRFLKFKLKFYARFKRFSEKFIIDRINHWNTDLFNYFNLAYFYQFYFNFDISKLKVFKFNIFYNYVYWFFFIIENWVKYLIILNLLVICFFNYLSFFKFKYIYSFDSTYSWQRINHHSFDQITAFEHFWLTNFSIQDLGLLKFNNDGEWELKFGNLRDLLKNKIKKFEINERINFKNLLKNREIYFRNYVYWKIYNDLRLENLKLEITKIFKELIRGTRNKYNYLNKLEFTVLFNYYYNINNYKEFFESLENKNFLTNYFFNLNQFYSLETNIMLLKEKDFKNRKRLYEYFFINKNNNHFYDFKFTDENTLNYFISLNSEMKSKLSISNIFADIGKNYNYNSFLFGTIDKFFNENILLFINKYLEKLNEIDILSNNLIFFRLFDYGDKSFQYETKLSLEQIKKYYSEVLFEKHEFYTMVDVDNYPNRYLLRENVFKNIEIAFGVDENKKILAIDSDDSSAKLSIWVALNFFFYFYFVSNYIFIISFKKRLFITVGIIATYLLFILKFFNKYLFFYFISYKFFFRKFYKKTRKLPSYRFNKIKWINFIYNENNFENFYFLFILYVISIQNFDVYELFSVFSSSIFDLELIFVLMFYFIIWLLLSHLKINGLFSKK